MTTQRTARPARKGAPTFVPAKPVRRDRNRTAGAQGRYSVAGTTPWAWQ